MATGVLGQLEMTEVEEDDELTGAINGISDGAGGKDAEDLHVADGTSAGDDGKNKDTAGVVTKTEEELAAEAASKVVPKTVEELDEVLKTTLDKVDELTQMIREQDRRNTNLERLYDKSQKLLKDANIITDDTLAEEKAASEAFQVRQDYLEQVLELMKINPKYEDVDEVVSQAGFDDMVEIMAKKVVADDPSVTFAQAKAGLTSEIWALKNPYKYMYDTIKKYAEVKQAGAAKPGAKSGAATVVSKDGAAVAVVKEAATSLQEVGGAGSVTDSVWTAAKVDALPENETYKVPEAIWTAYMNGTLK